MLRRLQWRRVREIKDARCITRHVIAERPREPLRSHRPPFSSDTSPLKIVPACPGEQRKLLVLLNPKSGPGKGREVFQKRIHPILSEAERPYEVHITKCSNYAREFVRTRDIYQWSGLLMVGGDGIVFEVVNGLFQRSDWEKALRELPLGVIPCGSGNGLAKSIAYAKQ